MKKFMKKGKNVLKVLAVCSLSLSLVACGGSDSSSDESTGTSDDIDTLIMGTNAEFPPYEFYEGQTIVGIDAEIAGAIAEKLGKELVIEDMAFGSLIASVSAGKIDMVMAGMTVSEERLQSVDFSNSYATGIQVVVVPEDSEITTVDDLFEEGKDYIIGVQIATTGDIYATGDFEESGLASLDRYNKGADAIQALVSGRVDCVMIDSEPAKSFVASNSGLKILDTEYAVEDYAIALAKNSELTDEVNSALDELIADGTVQDIIDKYISNE